MEPSDSAAPGWYLKGGQAELRASAHESFCIVTRKSLLFFFFFLQSLPTKHNGSPSRLVKK